MLEPRKLQSARLKATKTWPYLATAIWSLRPREKPASGTMAVDLWWHLYYDPRYVERLSVDELATTVCHEVSHLLREHPRRLKRWADYVVQVTEVISPEDAHRMEPEVLAELLQQPNVRWKEDGSLAVLHHYTVSNIAGDLEIDQSLARENLSGELLLPSLFHLPDGLLAEEYAELLLQQAKRSPKAAGEDEDMILLLPEGEGTGDSGEQAGGRSSQSPLSGHRPCGSGADGKPKPGEENGPGEDGIHPAEAELIRRKVAEDIREHVRAKGQGSVPGVWEDWAKEILEPVIPWQKVLAATVRRAVNEVAGRVDYSWRRPNRRQEASDVLLPGMASPAPEVAVVVDTSGSMGDREIAEVLGEVRGILASTGLRDGVRVLSVDAAVHATRRVFRPEQVEIVGRGGTDMGVGIEAAARLRPKPQIIVVLTDGETGWPAEPLWGIRVIAGIVGEEGSVETPPDWIRSIWIDRTRRKVA